MRPARVGDVASRRGSPIAGSGDADNIPFINIMLISLFPKPNAFAGSIPLSPPRARALRALAWYHIGLR